MDQLPSSGIAGNNARGRRVAAAPAALVPPVVKLRIPKYGIDTWSKARTAVSPSHASSVGATRDARPARSPTTTAFPESKISSFSDREDSKSDHEVSPKSPKKVLTSSVAAPLYGMHTAGVLVPSMSDRIGAYYAAAGVTISPKLYATHETDPAINSAYAGSASARRVLYYGKLYTSLPPSVVAEAQAAAVKSLGATKRARMSVAGGISASDDTPAMIQIPGETVNGADARMTTGGVAFATQAAVDLAVTNRELLRTRIAHDRIVKGSWESIDDSSVPPASSDPEFVHVDVCQLPLDLFDNAEFETNTPLQWMASAPRIVVTITQDATSTSFKPTAQPAAGPLKELAGTGMRLASQIAARLPSAAPSILQHAEAGIEFKSAAPVIVEGPIAYSPVFDKASWLWVPVVVTQYDEATDRYQVKFLTRRGVAGASATEASNVSNSLQMAQLNNGLNSADESGTYAQFETENFALPSMLSSNSSHLDQGFSASTPTNPAGLMSTALAAARNAAANRYPSAITVPASSKTDKWVKRLHIRFASESIEQFEGRRFNAHLFREATKCRIRYVEHLRRMPDIFTSLPPEWQREITKRAIRLVDPTPVLITYSDLVHTTMTEARDDFLLAIKHAIYQYLLLNPENREKHLKLKLPRPPKPALAPEFGMCAVSNTGSRVPFSGARKLLNESFALVTGPLHPCLLWLHDLFESAFGVRRFVDTRLPPSASLRGKTQDDIDREDERKRKRVRKRLLKSLRKKLKAPASDTARAPIHSVSSASVAKGDSSTAAAANILSAIANRRESTASYQSGSNHIATARLGDHTGPAVAFEPRTTVQVLGVPDHRRGSVLELITATVSPDTGDEVKYPTTLELWEKQQAEACLDLAEDIDEELRQRLATEIHERLGKSVSLFMRTQQELDQSPVKPMLFKSHVVLTQMLRVLVDNSIDDYIRFLLYASEAFNTMLVQKAALRGESAEAALQLTDITDTASKPAPSMLASVSSTALLSEAKQGRSARDDIDSALTLFSSPPVATKVQFPTQNNDLYARAYELLVAAADDTADTLRRLDDKPNHGSEEVQKLLANANHVATFYTLERIPHAFGQPIMASAVSQRPSFVLLTLVLSNQAFTDVPQGPVPGLALGGPSSVVQFHPSAAQIEASLLKTLEMITEAGSMTQSIDALLLGMMTAKPFTLLPIQDAAVALTSGQHNDERITTCATTLVRLMNAKAVIHHLVAAEMLRPAALAQRLDKFAWLAKESPASVLSSYSVHRIYTAVKGTHFVPYTTDEEIRAAEESSTVFKRQPTTTRQHGRNKTAPKQPDNFAVGSWSLDDIDARDIRGPGKGVPGEWRVTTPEEWSHILALLAASASGPAGSAHTAQGERLASALSLLAEDDADDATGLDLHSTEQAGKQQEEGDEEGSDQGEHSEQAEMDGPPTQTAAAPVTAPVRPKKEVVVDELALVRKYNNLAIALERLCDDETKFGLFSVDARPAKTALANHARKLANTVMDAIIADCFSVSKRVMSKFKHIMSHIASQPTDAQGLDNLRAFLSEMGSIVDALDAVMQETIQRLDSLNEFGRQLPWAVIQVAQAARLWPIRIQGARQQAQMFLQMLNERLTQQLADEKSSFERELMLFPLQIAEFYTVGGPFLLNALSSTPSTGKPEIESEEVLEVEGDAEPAAAPEEVPEQSPSFRHGVVVPPVHIPGSSPGGKPINPQAAKILVDRTCENAQQLQDRLDAAVARVTDFNTREKIVGMGESGYDKLKDYCEDFLPFYQLWSIVGDFEANRERWLTGTLTSLNASEIASQVTQWLTEVVRLQKIFKERALPAPLGIATSLRQRVSGFREIVPIIEALASKALKDWHWADIGESMGVELSMDDGFTMQDLLDMGVAKHVEKVQEIALVANKQFSLEKGLETMRKEWVNMSFTLVPYKNTGTYIVRAVDEISTLCDEHLVKTQSILSSPFVSHIEKSCKVWESKLLDATNLIEIWMTVQRAFMYLEPIFGSEDIMRQMPAEGKKFATVDQLWKRTLSQIHTYPRVMECVENPALAQTFESAAVKLDEIQKGLNAYLEMKRLAFPRFFFLSNDELLEILAETKDPTRVQPHLNKSFEGIASIDFQKASKETSADPSRMQVEDVVITAMISAEGEKVPFVNIVDPCSGSRRGNVEMWMNDVENAMKASIKDHTQRALYDYAFALAASNGTSLTALKGRSKSRDEWVLSWPGQVVLAVDQIFWTHGVEGALKDAENTNGTSMRNYLQTLNNQLAGIVTLVRGKLSPLQRMTLSALTTVDVHARDVVTHMVQENVRKLDAFEWFSQLRYYWQGDPSWSGSDGDNSANTNKPKAGGEEAGDAESKSKSKAMPTGGGKKAAANSAAAQLAAMGLGMATQQPSVMKEDPPRMPVRILNAVNPYAWEYLGNSARLVITPLTDRCYRTLIGAIHLMYGGAPAGPAGTGKTETTKDLAKAMAIQCVVFNCSDGLDYLAMAKFFKGLASAGAWSCFDEFNRIELEVLSVIAQQILTIQKAKREGAKRFVFEGTTLNMRASCNIFITMNPGYAGRSELPDNLKALFRPVAMMVPDYALISEIILFSYGFLEARTMARKVVQVLRLASEQLSSQSHYDYGMRAVKTILVAAGNLRRRLDDWPEDAITLRAILDANVPKFTSADIPLFRGIVTDLFPTTVLPQANDALLRYALTTVCQNTGLSAEPVFMEKCIQLYETVAVRHGLMLVGATLSGKSTVLRTLAKSLTGLSKKEWATPAEISGPDVEAGMSVPPRNVRTKAINPKSLALSHLFGTFDENTHEWTDGVLANAVRNFASDLTMAADLKWLVFDGPVDAVWIESMNTVLDDNKKLCLNSGEIVKITPEMTMMFEVDNLEQASPATVSRCGMVYLEPDQLGWKPLAKSWLGTLPDTDGLSGHKSFLLDLFDSMVPSLLALVTKKLRTTSAVPELSMLTSMLSLFGAVLSDSGIVTAPDAVGADGNVSSSAWRENLEAADLDAISTAERARLEAMFIYSALWSIGGNLDADSRLVFHTAFYRLLTGEPLAEFHVVGSYNSIIPPSPRPVSTAALPPVGAHRTLFDFQLDCAQLSTPLAVLQVRTNLAILAPERHGGTSPREVEAPDASPAEIKSPLPSPAVAASNAAANAEAAAALAAQRQVLFRTVTDTNIRWTSWAEQLISVAGPAAGSDVYPITSGIEFTDIIVPTVETVSRGSIINQLVQNRCHVLLTGVTGTGKSVAITRGLLPTLDPQRWMSTALQFSARTSSEQTQSIIDSKMSKRRVGVFGPPLGKRAVIFVDDLNMPAPDTYGSQAPIELLRQWMDYQGWYDRSEKGKPFRRLVDLQFIAAMASGRGSITPRYVRHFNTIGFVPFDDASLRRIFGSVVHWFFSGSTASEVTATAHQLVAATVDLYVSLAKALRPTPAKSHYTFNLRDVGRVFQGVTMAQSDSVSTSEHMIRLWGHECERVFADRLLESADIHLFNNTLAKQLQVHCKIDWSAVKASSAGEKESALTFANFLEQTGDAPTSKAKGAKGKTSKTKAAHAQKPYVQVASSTALNAVLKSYLDSYNTTAAASQKLDLVLFGAAREHVARIARCLSQPGGHALLLGVGGSGRRSLTKLAAFIEQCVVFEVEAGKSYTMNDWKEDAKGFMMRAGLENKQFVLFMPETSIVHEAMLEDINNVLNTGEIPNLLNAEDQGQIIAGISNEAKHAARAAIVAKGGDTSSGVNISNAEVMMYFRKKCARNLHVVLAFSPLSQSFRPRLRAFPSLVNCCYIDFFHNWPAEALTSVAHRVLGGNATILSEQGKPALQTALVAAGLSPSIVHKGSDVEEEEKLLDASSADAVVAVCVEMQVSATALSEAYAAEQGRKNYVTPTTYLQLLKIFASLLASKKKLLSHQEMRYVKGVQSIESTEELVATMQAELQALQPTLEKAKEETNAMMVDIEKQQKEADVTEALCEQEKKVCLTTAAEAQKMTNECQADLAEALPALEAAVEALKTLTKSDLVLVKSMQKPPNGVRIVMETVCILLGVAPEKVKGPDGKNVNDYWDAAKKHLLSDPKFMTRLLKYDKDSLSDEIAAALAPYITDPEFQPDKVAKASSAAEGLCKFVRAMCTYQRVAKTVEPKRKKLAEASAQLAEAQAILKAKEERLAEVKSYVAKLKRQLQEANDKKRELERQVNDCIVKLDRAQQLIAGLGGEKGRWRDSAADFARRSANLLGDMLLSAGITTYLGAFSSAYRARAIESWTVAIDAKGLPRSTSYSLRGALADDVTVRMWTANNLPADSFSIDSASMMFNSAQWPLLIDPQRQANRWIRKMEAEFTTTLASMFAAKSKGSKGDKSKDVSAAIRVLRMNSSGFNRAIQQAVQLGMPVLIENVGENVDPYLDPLLLHQVTKNGMMMNVRLGEDVVEYNPSFRLYMTTELANPHYSPETKAKVNVLNFAATVEGLADQMLGIVVAAESPDLEAQREALVKDTAATLSQIAAIEDNILRLLAASEGDILEDENLISTLKSSRVTSEQAAEKMVLAERTQKRISATRVEYTPVAQRAATLYFVVACLAGVEPMYQFSLEWFIRLFLTSIAAAPASKKQMQGRLKSVIDTFTQNLYLNVCRSLFEKDKLLFSMILTIRILESEGFILEEEARYFLTGNTALELVKPNPAKSAGSTLAELNDVTRVEEGNESDEDEDAHSDAQSTTASGVSWLTDAIWGDLVGLSKLSALSGIDDEVANNLRQWFAVVSTAFDPLTIIKDLVGHDEHGGDALDDSHGTDSTARAAGAGSAAVMALKRHNSVLPRAMTKANMNRLGSFVGGKDTGRSSADPSKTRWSHLTSFHHLLLLRCLRPDKIVPALQQFISDNLGRQFVEVPTFDLQQSFNDSACDAPLVFVLSPGADPTAELLRLADMKGFGRKLKIVSLGQGQGPIAESAIAEAIDSGLWVCLQNCHLATSWMSTLEHLVEEITADRTHPEFRLWLTSMPDKAFPVSVLQRSIKMTNEPPKGIRANMLGSYLAINEPWFEDCAQPRAFKKLLFGLCFFHAVVQERRRFGPLGWNETYNFTDADLSISISQLRMFLDEGAPSEAWAALAEYRGLRNAAKGISVSPTPGVPGVAAPASSRRSSVASSRSRHSGVDDEDDTVRDPFAGIPLNIPFPALQYLVTACNYGGRVTDDKDARTLDAVLRGFYSPEILEEGYRLSEGGTYFVPTDGPLSTYVDYVKALPLSDGPEIFGLHENAAITTALTEMRALLSTGLAVLPAGTSKASKTDGEPTKDTADAKDAPSARPAAKHAAGVGASAGVLTLSGELLAKLPASFDVEDVARKFPVKHEQSMNTVLVQELIRYNKLLGVVRSSLTQLSDAVQGLVVMSAQLDAMATALQQNRVPATWHASSYPSLKPLGSWIVDLCNRIAFFETWVRDGPPAAFWISGFFFPQSFLTGQLQNYARKTQLPIDTIEFDFSILDSTNPTSISQAAEDGAYIYGLFLEGAAWDIHSGVMCEQAPKELLCSIPIMWIKPHALNTADAHGHDSHSMTIRGKHVYQCPMYRTALRRGTLSTTGHSTMWVMNVMLPMPLDKTADHYVKRGTALLCQTSD